MAAPIRRHFEFPDIRRTLDQLTRMSPTGKVTSQLLEGLLEGWLEYFSMFDDMDAPASAVAPIPAFAPDRDDDGTLLFDHNTTQQGAVVRQIPHSWKEGTIIYPHVHWSKTTDAAGDVAWEYRYRIINVNQIVPSWSSWIPVATRSFAVASEQRLIIDEFPPLTMTTVTLSAMLSIQIQRNTANDDYGDDARFWEWDAHIEKNKHGSEQPFVEGSVGFEDNL